MKRVFIFISLTILLISLTSAEITITQQPEKLYNLGQIIKIPLKISTNLGIQDFFSVKLICNGIETEIQKQYIALSQGEEQEIIAAIPLNKEFIGNSVGICRIKAILGQEFILTKEFKISDLITINAKPEKTEISPNENLIIKGNAIKENKENVQGFVSLEMVMDGETILTSENTVKNGFFLLNASIPDETKAGEYLAKVKVFEKEKNGNISNKGEQDFNILVKQIPKNLEIVFEKKPVEPGTDLKIKAILHDQTGEKIDTNALIIIKNEDNKILEKKEIKTDEFLSFPIKYNQAPSQWTISAKAEKINLEENFNISEKKQVKVELINRTIIITNIGNVPYNDTALIKIGNETINLDVFLNVDEKTKYYLSAPAGEYDIEVMAGDKKLKDTITLTGNAIGVKEISGGIFSKILGPFVWMFIIGVLGFMGYVLYKKGYKKTFIGYIKKKKAEIKDKITNKHHSLINSKNKAELSLSIKGEKQNISLICLKIKNEKEILKNKSVKEKLNDLAKIVEETKAVAYENHNNIFFMWVPLKTKTFKNEKTAVETAQKIKESIDKYNKIAKQKIDYGISLNYGTIIAKLEKDSLKFMSMGVLMTIAKKIAGLADKEIYLSEKINEKVMTQVKTEKHEKENLKVYTIKEIRNKKEEDKKIINNFIKKLQKEKKEKKK